MNTEYTSHCSWYEGVTGYQWMVLVILILSLSLSGIIPLTFYIPISYPTLPRYTLRNHNQLVITHVGGNRISY